MTPKTCNVCGHVYSETAWHALPSIGTLDIPADEYGPRMCVDMRNCACGETMAVDTYEQSQGKGVASGAR